MSPTRMARRPGSRRTSRVEVPEPAPEPEPVPVPALPFLDWAIEWVIRQAQSLLRR